MKVMLYGSIDGDPTFVGGAWLKGVDGMRRLLQGKVLQLGWIVVRILEMENWSEEISYQYSYTMHGVEEAPSTLGAMNTGNFNVWES